jgi:hypothetical protein
MSRREWILRCAVVAALALTACGPTGSHGGLTAVAGVSSAAVVSSSVRAEITSPSNGAHVAAATPLSLVGRATDPSGAPVQALFAWSSSIDGALGSGSTLVVPYLTPGVHQILLDATTPSGDHGSATSILVVGGAGQRTGQDLADYLKALPASLLGQPIKFPPDFKAMIDANPSDVNGIAGTGGLSAGFSEAGTLTVLRWPGPASLDHLDWFAVPGKPKGTGALASMGSFAGVNVMLPGGRVTSWLRDATWKRTQAYASDGSPVLVTDFDSVGLGLHVRVEAFVDATDDVLGQRFSVERLAGSSAGQDVRLVFYENFSPCTLEIPFLPISDVQLDMLNDFACGWHQGESALVHFRPKKADYAALGAFAASPHPNLLADVATWLDAADARFGPGVTLAVGADRPASGYQCGFDGTSVTPSAPDRDAYAEACDGALGMNPIALVRANAAIETQLDLTPGKDAVTYYVSAASSWKDARDLLRKARAMPADDHLRAAEQDAATWLARARLPAPPADARTVAFAKRSLLVARTSTSRVSGAIAASIATQINYGSDWPRDGSFIDRALEAAGYPDVVDRHAAFYVKTQRTTGLFAGTWHMNFMDDGTNAGPVPLEIDTTAFATWTLAAHADAIANPAARSAYLASVYPTIRRAAMWLVAWRDPLTGLQLPANEDDNIAPTRTLHGAGPVLLAIRSAIEAGRATGESPSVLAAWQSRADELASAIDRTYWDPTLRAWADPSSGTAFNGGPHKSSAWLLWPVQFQSFTDPRTLSTADWIFGGLSDVVKKKTTISAYDPKLILSLAKAWRGDPAKTALLRDALATFTHELPTDGTLHVGEFYEVRPDPRGTPRWTPLNDVPHVWEHMLVYHASIELYP